MTKGAGGEPPSPGGVSDVPEVMDRHEAFTQFKAAEGAETNNTLRAAKATQKQMRARRVELGGTVNASKQRCARGANLYHGHSSPPRTCPQPQSST